VVRGQGCSTKRVRHQDKAVPQGELWFEESTAAWGAEGEAVGVQLPLGVAGEGQVGPGPQMWEHQGHQSGDSAGGGDVTRHRLYAVSASEMSDRVVQ